MEVPRLELVHRGLPGRERGREQHPNPETASLGRTLSTFCRLHLVWDFDVVLAGFGMGGVVDFPERIDDEGI